jgi:peroxiredoxin
MRYSLITISCLFLWYSSIGQNTIENSSEFVFKGKIVGQDSGFVHLSYSNSSGKYIHDSVYLTNGKFEFKGFISEPTISYFYGKRKSRSVDDPNSSDIYLEPTKINAIFKLDSLNTGIITGSKSQQEFDFYNQQNRILENKWAPIYISLKEARSKNDTVRIDQIYSNEFPKINAQSDSLSFSFIKEYPNSFVSAMLLQYQTHKISIDSLKLIYARLTTHVQESKRGKYINEFIKKAESLKIGRPAPGFTELDVNNKKISLADFRGKYVFLDFWASYCSPCRAEHPYLKQLYSKFHNQGFEIIGISVDNLDKKEDWLEAIKNDALPWLQICDFKGWAGEIVNNYNLFGKGIPSNFLINPEGIIIGKDLHEEALTKKLTELFSK